MLWEIAVTTMFRVLAEPGMWNTHLLAMGGSLFGVGLIVGWLLAWFVLAGSQAKTKDR